jgi:hypothetical protein
LLTYTEPELGAEETKKTARRVAAKEAPRQTATDEMDCCKARVVREMEEKESMRGGRSARFGG